MKCSQLIGRVEEQMGAVQVKAADEDSVHDLRTSIRRLSECLRTFEQVFPDGKADSVRRKLKKLMDLAASVRNLDIAGELFSSAQIPQGDPVFDRLHGEVTASRAALLNKLDDWLTRKRPEHWRRMLQ